VAGNIIRTKQIRQIVTAAGDGAVAAVMTDRYVFAQKDSIKQMAGDDYS